MYFYSNQLTPHNYFIPNHPIYLQSQDSFTPQQQRISPSNSSTTTSIHLMHNNNSNDMISQTLSNEQNYMPTSAPQSNNNLLHFSTMFNNNNNLPYSSNNNTQQQGMYNTNLPSAPPVPSSMIPPPQISMYGYGTPTNTSNASFHSANNSTTTQSSPIHGGIDLHFS